MTKENSSPTSSERPAESSSPVERTFTLPVSDCGCFTAGRLDAAIFTLLNPQADERPRPEYGVIVWYETKEAARVACDAATKAHWL